jgi:hypothetical protein
MHRLRRLLFRTVPASVAATLVATGLAAPSATPSRPVVTDKVQSLSKGTVERGWSRAADTSHPTELVGFEWQGGDQGTIEVRAKRSGHWSGWHQVESDPTEGPDLGSREPPARNTAGPVWVGRGTRQVEVRVVDGRIAALKLHAIHSDEPGASGGTKPAGAVAPQPGIVSRQAWRADESYRTLHAGCSQPEYAPAVRLGVVHHTVTANDYAPSDSASFIRGIYYFHTHTNGWCDIGYNFLVDRFGTAFEGRFGGIASPVVGAHALGFNRGSTGVALLGTFTTAPMPGPMYEGLRALLAWKLSIHDVDPTATIDFNDRRAAALSGHRDLDSTVCPGDMPYAALPQLRRELAGMEALAPKLNVSSVLSGKLLDVSARSQSPGAAVIQWPANGGPNQQWRFEPVGDQVYKIVSVNSGQVLDVAGRSTAPGTRVIQWPWNGGTNQQWRVEPVGDQVRIVSVNSGQVLDVEGASSANGTSIIQWPWNGGANQRWARPQVG